MKVLIVEDRAIHVSRLLHGLSAEDSPTVCNTFEQAAGFTQQADAIEWPALVILDAMFPLTDGGFVEFMADRFLELLQRCADVKAFRPPVVILVSSDSRVTEKFERVEYWLNNGVLLDVIEKGSQPIFETLLRHKVERCRPTAQLRSAGYADAVASLESHGIITRDPELAAYLWFETTAAATSGVPTWITGEKGSGKNGIAHAISMIRSRRPALVFNCNTVPATLFQSELFGTVRGAADGAVDRKSRFEEAGDGVLFLDEFCSMPFEHQRLLNQVVEYRGFSRLGESELRRAKCMFVVADLLTPEAATDSGRLHPDVRDRLVGGVIVVPPLRDRINDIPALVEGNVPVAVEI